jgi:hypothetical protein
MEILSLVLDLQGKYLLEGLSSTLSMLSSRVELPVEVGLNKNKALGSCSYLTVLCGLLQPSRLVKGIASQLRLKAFNTLSAVVLLLALPSTLGDKQIG